MTQTMQMPEQAVGQQPAYIITDEDKKRLEDIQLAWKAYDGQLEKPLRRMPDQADDNVMSNACAPIVDTGVDFLFGKELEISVGEDAPDEAQKAIDEVWGRKETRIPLLQKLAMNGAMAGQAFLRIMPVGSKTFRLIVVDPSTVYVQTDPQDCETVQLYCIQYATTQKINGRDQQVYYREEIARIDPDGDGDDGNPFADTDATWSIQHWSRTGEHGPWTPAGDAYVWPYLFAPLFSCQNLPKPNSFWGKPDITPDIIGLNNSLNLVQSSTNRNLKMFGQPILYSTGVGPGVDIKVGVVNNLPLAESKIVAVALPSDVANALAFAENVRSDLDEVSAVPGVATGRMASLPRGDMAGTAIELLYVRIIKKTDKKQNTYGEMLIDVSKAILMLKGFSQDIDIELSWQTALPHDDLPSGQYAVLLKQLGVSTTTILRELGMDPDEEMALNQAEQQQQMLNYSKGIGLPPPSLLPPTPQLGQPQPAQTQPTSPAAPQQGAAQ